MTRKPVKRKRLPTEITEGGKRLKGVVIVPKEEMSRMHKFASELYLWAKKKVSP